MFSKNINEHKFYLSNVCNLKTVFQQTGIKYRGENLLKRGFPLSNSNEASCQCLGLVFQSHLLKVDLPCRLHILVFLSVVDAGYLS